MKGGITSGVVYPGAITRIATDFRFRNLGGASAGAIAAVAAAACEYRWNQGDPAAYDALGEVSEEISGPGFVLRASSSRRAEATSRVRRRAPLRHLQRLARAEGSRSRVSILRGRELFLSAPRWPCSSWLAHHCPRDRGARGRRAERPETGSRSILLGIATLPSPCLPRRCIRRRRSSRFGRFAACPERALRTTGRDVQRADGSRAARTTRASPTGSTRRSRTAPGSRSTSR